MSLTSPLRGLALFPGETTVSGPAQHDANFDVLSAKCDRPSVRLKNFNSHCDSWKSLVRLRENKIFRFRASLNTTRNELTRFNGQTKLLEKEKEKFAFEREACNAKVNRLQAQSNCYRGACTHVTKHLVGESSRQKQNLAATDRFTKSETKRLLQGVMISAQHCL